MKSVIKQMGGFHLIDEVDDSTTHVICGEKRRTLNILYAIARGCWLVSQEWVGCLAAYLLIDNAFGFQRVSIMQNVLS